MTKRGAPEPFPADGTKDDKASPAFEETRDGPVGSVILQRALSMTGSFARFGLALVPVCPSDEACEAGARAAGVSKETARRIYSAMVEAD